MNSTLRKPISLLHISKICVLTSLGMISLFFLMKLLNLNTILELRYLNFVFFFFAVRHVLLHKQHTDETKVSFHTAMMMGFITVLFSSVLFSAFVFTYLSLDSTFMTMVSFTEPFGKYLSPASGAFVVFLEGVATGSVVAIPVLRTLRKREREELAGETIQLLNRL